mmetsp:Transcript_96714/g.242621  ORF Transcript_96714/g.242621 Transcript_96714/m.242621 type:complete len:204 (+) Transcript_96714:801-1412(+)
MQPRSMTRAPQQRTLPRRAGTTPALRSSAATTTRPPHTALATCLRRRQPAAQSLGGRQFQQRPAPAVLPPLGEQPRCPRPPRLPPQFRRQRQHPRPRLRSRCSPYRCRQQRAMQPRRVPQAAARAVPRASAAAAALAPGAASGTPRRQRAGRASRTWPPRLSAMLASTAAAPAARVRTTAAPAAEAEGAGVAAAVASARIGHL